MKYLDTKKLDSIDAESFQNEDPYPFVNPQHCLTEEGFRSLLASMPEPSEFDTSFGVERKHGQASHDRYVLEYVDGIDLPEPWQEFIDELKSNRYRNFIRRLLGRGNFLFRFHWHYTPNGCVVSPHCDSSGKIGSQIFYLNTKDDWDPTWGGETLILEDHGRFDVESSPAFEDFDTAVAAETMDNRSLIFGRRENSWHGVRPIVCPEGAMRKVFIVVFEDVNPRKMLFKRLRRLLRGKPMVTEKERAMY
jgi:hypothetical protein